MSHPARKAVLKERILPAAQIPEFAFLLPSAVIVLPVLWPGIAAHFPSSFWQCRYNSGMFSLARAALLSSGFLIAAQTPEFDILIRNGRIVDGTGNPWFLGDVGIAGDHVAAIGRLEAARAKRVIDAAGKVVCPGFIDIHSHGGRNLAQVPTAENYVRQGVTLLVEGNDGGSPVPLGPHLDKLAALPKSVNIGYFAGQGSIRQSVMGLVNRAATAEEIGKMRDIARQSMLDGALGLSTGLFYVPGNFSSTAEVIELAKAAGLAGGMHISHMRNEAAGVLDSVRETIRIGEEGGLPTEISHHKIIGKANWSRSAETLKLIDEARARGVDVTVDAYPYTASSTGTAALFPQWALEGGPKALNERLASPESRARIKAAIVENIQFDRGGGDPRNVLIASCGFDASLAGKNLAEATTDRQRTPDAENAAETAIELQQRGGCSAIYHAIAEEDVERILKYPHTMIASDGEIPIFGQANPHPRAYGTFPRVLGRYVRERRVITLEDAIRRMTTLPAGRLKLFDRGLLRPGMKADIAVFDPSEIADRADFKNPHQYAVGVAHVLVNGRPVLLDGKITEERPGIVVRGPGYSK
jgi:dihydroorotase/N-acyl-D-amino-acid deacylase